MKSPSASCPAWQPTCDTQTLRLRAAALAAVRSFFTQQKYLEVETPLLSGDIVVDAHLEPFVVSQDESDLYLQTSPEAGMKRLLAAGSGSIFQITKSFRKGEAGQRHNPEFTMIEWYGVGDSWRDQMAFTETLVRHVVVELNALTTTSPLSAVPFKTTTYDAAFLRELNITALETSLAELQHLMTSFDPHAPQLDDQNDALNLLLSEHIEPSLGCGVPEFLHDYPLSQAALAVQNSDDPRTACRFELYWNGVELCNGYEELTDPDELVRRDALQNSSRQQHLSDSLPGAPRLLAAMQHGLPPCSGVALGFDRLLMCLLGRTDIKEVIPFPIDRA